MARTRITAAVIAAMAFHYGLSRVLAAAVTFAEKQEEGDLR
jgi:hypothetical protein